MSSPEEAPSAPMGPSRGPVQRPCRLHTPSPESHSSPPSRLTRKPDSQHSNLHAYLTHKRKSLSKNSPAKTEESSSTSHTTPQPPASSSSQTEEVTGEMRRFKKKAMSKEEIVEIKGYVRALQEEGRELSEAARLSHEGGPPGSKDKDKKSKTEYFQPYDFPARGPDNSQVLSETERAYLEAMRAKSRSADEANLLLQKRLQWLREEMEAQLEKQQSQAELTQRLAGELRAARSRVEELEAQESQRQAEQLESRDREIAGLRGRVRELESQVEGQRSTAAEGALAGEERQKEWEEKEQHYRGSIQELSGKVEELLQEFSEQPCQSSLSVGRAEGEGARTASRSEGRAEWECLSPEGYSESVVEALLRENKYLRVENHMLQRYKYEARELERENKRLSVEHCSLRRKMLENARREMVRFREEPSDDSELFSLSEASQLAPSQLAPSQ